MIRRWKRNSDSNTTFIDVNISSPKVLDRAYALSTPHDQLHSNRLMLLVYNIHSHVLKVG